MCVVHLVTRARRLLDLYLAPRKAQERGESGSYQIVPLMFGSTHGDHPMSNGLPLSARGVTSRDLQVEATAILGKARNSRSDAGLHTARLDPRGERPSAGATLIASGDSLPCCDLLDKGSFVFLKLLDS